MAFYLFPGAMYLRLKELNKSASRPLKEDYQLYDLACKQYLGLGFLSQFIPGTSANKARQQLSNKLEPAIEASTSESRVEHRLAFFYKYATNSRLYSYLNFAPVLNFISRIINGFKLGAVTYTTGHADFINPTPYSSQDLSLKDLVVVPVRLSISVTYKLLDWLHNGVNKIFNLGTLDHTKSSLPRIFLKGLASLVFGLAKTPLIAADALVLLAEALVETIIISPLNHLVSNVYGAYSNRNQKVLFATVKELQDVKELRKTAKGQEECSYTVMKSMQRTSKEYVGIEKGQLYSSAANPEKVVALKGSAEKIEKSAALLSIVNSYSAKQKIAKNEPVAVEEASSILNLGV
ncbi:MAG: hypothetical protein H0U73_13115 [Tatlockia sp.]|nr:hypothetical protein [Tatlockia sp.]